MLAEQPWSRGSYSLACACQPLAAPWICGRRRSHTIFRAFAPVLTPTVSERCWRQPLVAQPHIGRNLHAILSQRCKRQPLAAPHRIKGGSCISSCLSGAGASHWQRHFLNMSRIGGIQKCVRFLQENGALRRRIVLYGIVLYCTVL